jgi:hypothetical protein
VNNRPDITEVITDADYPDPAPRPILSLIRKCPDLSGYSRGTRMILERLPREIDKIRKHLTLPDDL